MASARSSPQSIFFGAVGRRLFAVPSLPAPAATSPRSVPSGTAVSATVHRPPPRCSWYLARLFAFLGGLSGLGDGSSPSRIPGAYASSPPSSSR